MNKPRAKGCHVGPGPTDSCISNKSFARTTYSSSWWWRQ